MTTRNRIALSLLAATAAALSMASSAVAGPVTLRCFSGGEGQCNAALDTASLIVPADSWAGVYINSRATSGKLLSAVAFSFTRQGSVAGGAPRFSIPVSLTGQHAPDGYAFIDVNSCGGADVVSTESSTCGVYFGAEFFPNWAAFAAAYPTAMIAPGAIPFIISDAPGEYTISNIVLRQIAK